MTDSFDGSIGSERESVLVFVSLAEEFFKNGSFDEAINYCKMALMQIADLKEAKLLLYDCYKKLGLDQDAENMKIELISENPDDKDVQLLFNDTEKSVIKEEPIKTKEIVTKPDFSNIPEQESVESEEKVIAEEEKIEKENESKIPQVNDNEMLSATQTEVLLDNALSEINSIKGVLGSIIIEESGIIIKEKTVEGLDAEVASALFSTIFYVSEDSIGKLNLGLIDRVFIEIGKVRVYLFKGNGYIIGIFTEEIVKIGLIHVKAKQLLINIKKVLGV